METAKYSGVTVTGSQVTGCSVPSAVRLYYVSLRLQIVEISIQPIMEYAVCNILIVDRHRRDDHLLASRPKGHV